MPARTSCPAATASRADFLKAKNIFAGGYSRATSHDTRLRLALEIMNLPYKMVTGFQGTGQLNQAMLKNEVNFTGSSLPGFQTQVIPQIIKPGIGVVLFHHPVMGPDGKAQGQSAAREAGHHHLLPVLQAGVRQGAVGRQVRRAVPDERHLDQDAARHASAQGLAAGSGRRRCARRSRRSARTTGLRHGLQEDHRRGAGHRQPGRDRADLRAHPQGQIRRSSGCCASWSARKGKNPRVLAPVLDALIPLRASASESRTTRDWVRGIVAA